MEWWGRSREERKIEKKKKKKKDKTLTQKSPFFYKLKTEEEKETVIKPGKIFSTENKAIAWKTCFSKRFLAVDTLNTWSVPSFIQYLENITIKDGHIAATADSHSYLFIFSYFIYPLSSLVSFFFCSPCSCFAFVRCYSIASFHSFFFFLTEEHQCCCLIFFLLRNILQS